MKTLIPFSAWHLRRSGAVLALLACLMFAVPLARARTITLNLEFARQQYSNIDPYSPGQIYYTVIVGVSSDSQPITYDQVNSPGANPIFGGSESGYGYTEFGDLDSAIYAATNGGAWTLTVNAGDPSQQQYTFNVSVQGMNECTLPTLLISAPTDGSTEVSTNAAFIWSGPTSWDEEQLVVHDLDYSFYDSDSPAASSTNWPEPPSLPLGTNEFELTLLTNASPWVTISTPVNSQSQPYSTWVGESSLMDFAQSGFICIANPAAILPGTGHTLFANYTFTNDATIFDLGDDSSPASNGMNSSYSYWGEAHTNSTDAITGGGAVQFFGTSCMTPDSQVQSNIDNLLTGSFTFSTWVNTTTSVGNDSDDAVSGQTIFWAYDDHYGTNDAIPLAITGSKAAFSVREHLGNTTTVHSTTSVNDGTYHLITVTRNQTDGEMKMYVDGNYQGNAIGTMEPLNGNNYFISIGGTTISSYTGLLDDMQVYTGVLSAAEIAQIYANPGATVSNLASQASYGVVAHYDFDEGAPIAPDVSGSGNSLWAGGNFGGNGPVISNNAEAGPGAVYLDGGSYLTAPSNLLSTLSGDFSISLWVNTTQDYDYSGDYAYNGAGIISAYIPSDYVTNDLVPIALCGGQVAFDTGEAQDQNEDTLTSSSSVNDGSWHHIVVCRNQTTGEKDIYVDGVLDTSDIDTTATLNAPQLLTIGAIADASNPDPFSPSETGNNGYQGLLDDIQIYDLVLSSDEVAYLYAHPGLTTGQYVVTSAPYPVNVGLQVTFIRSQDPNLGLYYSAAVSFNSVTPTASTTNSVTSPSGYFISEQYPGGGTGSSAILGSLSAVLNECTNGQWSIYINQGSPTQQVYTFQMSSLGLTSNMIPAVTEFTPTNWQVNLPTNPPYYWTGPSNYSTLQVDLLSGPVAELPITATNWPSAPPVAYGTNRFDVDYNSNNFPAATFTVTSSSPTNTLVSWTPTVTLSTEDFDYFVVGAPAPLPVTLTNVVRTAGNIEFSFTTVAGRPHFVQSRTNLTVGSWVNVTNFIGNGAVEQFTFPATNPPVQFFRVDTQ